jgi:alkane 1-monooxygenase
MSSTNSAAPPPSRWAAVAGSYFGYLLFVCFAASIIIRGPALALPTLFVLVVVPALDMLSGESHDDFVRGNFSRKQQYLLTLAPIGFVIGYSITIFVAASEIQHVTIVERVLLVVSVGMIGSIDITAAHELVHKSSRLQKFFGRIGLLNVCYAHFEINHIEGHHVWIGTDRDESTARRGESLYKFLARTVPGCLRLSWALEVKRLRHRGLGVLTVRNRMLHYIGLQLAYLLLLVILDGVPAVLFFFGQAVAAIFMLESVAYIEHYGLLRQKLPNDRYSPMSASHSWDSYHRFSNYLEFQLQRHADHHAAPARAQELLRHAADAPRLPAGYPVMITLAMIPPVWRRVIDPRIPS